MALTDNAVITAAVGYIFTAPVGTAAPSPAVISSLNLLTFASLPAAWEQLGHTSRDKLPDFDITGGDYKVKGTWQKQSLRQVADKDPAITAVKFVLEQFDASALELYFGENTSVVPGVYEASGDYVPVERALLVVIADGDTKVAFHSHKASFAHDASIEMGIDSFLGFPVKASLLNYGSNGLFRWVAPSLLDTAPVSYTLTLGGASGGDYVLDDGGVGVTTALAYTATATDIKTALGAVDDGFPASAWTVTGSVGGPFTITGPLAVSVSSDSTTGGTGVTVA